MDNGHESFWVGNQRLHKEGQQQYFRSGPGAENTVQIFAFEVTYGFLCDFLLGESVRKSPPK